MTRKWIFGIAVAAIVSCCLIYIYRPPSRPGGVPQDAVPVGGAKTTWWQVCRLNREVICQIYTEHGHVLYDEEFVPYNGNPAVGASELVIPRKCTYAAPTRICLSNGRILIPKSRFEIEKQFLDELFNR
jgi:hypothetical protein